MVNLSELTNKEIRLALDMIRDRHPLYKKTNLNTLAKVTINIFDLNLPVERIVRVPSFKKILFRTVIHSVTKKNGKYKIKNKRILK